MRPINRYNLDKIFEQRSTGEVHWQALTTGGFDAWLQNPDSGILRIDTALVQTQIPVADIGRDDLVFDAGGIRRRIRVFRMPDENLNKAVHIERRIRLRDKTDNALYICLTQEDGHLVWSSPIYIFH